MCYELEKKLLEYPLWVTDNLYPAPDLLLRQNCLDKFAP